MGRPFGVRPWVVCQDNVEELAEVGDIGELILQGAQVARGYLKDPAKTDTVFISKPRWLTTRESLTHDLPRVPERLYRTGDLVRLRKDGSLFHVGRIDSQMKVRGQRLELSEVEIYLQDTLQSEFDDTGKCRLLSAIDHVVVEAVQTQGSGSSQLLAFLCLKTSEPIGSFDWELGASLHSSVVDLSRVFETNAAATHTLSGLVARVTARMKFMLPTYAIPSAFIPLQSVPQAVSLKTDRTKFRSIAARFSLQQMLLFCSSMKGDGDSLPDTPVENETHHQSSEEALLPE